MNRTAATSGRGAARQSALRVVAATAVVSVASATLVATPATAAATVSEFVAAADSYVSSVKPSSNYGTATKLYVDASPTMRTLVRFDSAGVTDPITRATLRVYVARSSTTFSVHRLDTAAWEERRVTYANAPGHGATGVSSGAVSAGQWISIDVTSLVTAGSAASLALVTTSSNSQAIASRETTSKPTLVIETGSVADLTAPAVGLTSPSSGTTYSEQQTVSVAASASDDTGVTKVEFYDNDVLAATDDTAPYAHAWAVSSAGNGAHTWTSKAFDAAGNSATSEPVSVTVDIQSTSTAPVVPATPAAETMPVPHSGDAADDIAIWPHPTDSGLSTVIGTDKQGGLAVYDLSGRQLHYYADSSPNNVDVRNDFMLGGQRTSIVTTSSKIDDAIRVYRVDPVTRGLEYVAARTLSVGLGIAGLCMYRSAATGRHYVFDSDSSGTLQQWEIFDNGAGKVDAKKVRTLKVGSTTEGCVADDELGHLYVSEEDVALWKYSAEPGGGSARTSVDVTGADGHLTADIEGLALYDAGAGTGYLLASSQGSSDYAVYTREGANTYVTSFDVADGSVDGTSSTDGIDATSLALGAQFPEGMFVAQDGRNDSGNQNFKLVPWGSVARSVDPPLVTNGGSPPAPRTPSTFYVDSTAGSDASVGTGPEDPWRTLDMVTNTALVPGDRVLLKRGATWDGKVHVSESGTSDLPITIGAYGDGVRPRIQSTSTCVELAGSNIAVVDLHVDSCGSTGIGVAGSANRVERSVVSNNVVGIYVRATAVETVLTDNELIDNNRMSVLSQSPTNDDSGAMAILIHGDRTDVAYNHISGSDAFSYDYGRDGAAIEIYGGRDNHIHHNVGVDNDAFSELGNARSADNTFAYNVVRSSLSTSTFVVTRGASSSYGPVLRTKLLNNSVLMTGAESQGFVCHAGCGPDILTTRNNVIKAVDKAGYADAAFDEADGVYEGPVRFVLGPGSVRASIGFRDEPAGDLRLVPGSPAIDTGSRQPYDTDIDRLAVPVDGNRDGVIGTDRGAYEYR